MKNIIGQVVHSLNTEPEAWTPTHGMFSWDGAQKGEVSITGYGNSRLLSVANLVIKGKRIETENPIYKWRLEAAMIKYYKGLDVNNLIDKGVAESC